MKKFFLSVALMMTLGPVAVMAGVPDIDAKVLNSFKTQFASATEVEWSVGSEYYKASFLYNNNYVFAYYSTDGEFLATLRNISSVNLPVMLQTSLKNDYEDYWISDLYELAKNDGTAYYVTLENGEHKIVLKSAGGSEWTVFKKTNKT
jgi:hypothetical protein